MRFSSQNLFFFSTHCYVLFLVILFGYKFKIKVILSFCMSILYQLDKGVKIVLIYYPKEIFLLFLKIKRIN